MVNIIQEKLAEMGIPFVLWLMLRQPDFDSYDLSSWRIGGFGGAPTPIST